MRGRVALVVVAVLAEIGRVPVGWTDPDEPGHRRVLVHSSGFQMSPYADIKPAGDDTRDVARKVWVEEGAQRPSRNLWHRSPGSPG